MVLELHKAETTITLDVVVTQKWNPEEQVYTLHIKDQEWTAEEISQIVFDQLFFVS